MDPGLVASPLYPLPGGGGIAKEWPPDPRDISLLSPLLDKDPRPPRGRSSSPPLSGTLPPHRSAAASSPSSPPVWPIHRRPPIHVSFVNHSPQKRFPEPFFLLMRSAPRADNLLQSVSLWVSLCHHFGVQTPLTDRGVRNLWICPADCLAAFQIDRTMNCLPFPPKVTPFSSALFFVTPLGSAQQRVLCRTLPIKIFFAALQNKSRPYLPPMAKLIHFFRNEEFGKIGLIFFSTHCCL